MKPISLRSLQRFLLPAVVSTVLAPSQAIPGAASFEVDGALMNVGAINSLITAFAANSAPASLNPNYVALANAAGVTWNVANVPTGMMNTTIVRSGAAGVTDTTDLAYNIGNSMPGVFNGMTFPLLVTNLNTGTLTVAAGAGVTLAGTTTISTLCARWYQGKFTQVTTTSGYGPAGITGGTYSQTGNLVTLTLTGNTASAPTVGQVIQLTPTSGALGTLNSASWFPIITVSSATSFIVFNPVSQTTSGNISTSATATVAPAPVYSPLVTLQGMFASVTGFTA